MSGVGLGGVMSEVAWMATDGPVKLEQLIKKLAKRFDICSCEAEEAINMAKKCGVVKVENNIVILQHRPKHK